MRAATGTPSAAVVWHDVECGAYAGDLALWRELAATSDGAVLELGCGTGRVALDLARAGHDVVGLDSEPELVAEVERRAAAEEISLEAIRGDVRRFDLARLFDLVIAPMQLIHLLGGADGRAGLLASAQAHLTPGGRLAVALLAAEALRPPVDPSPPLPDVRELRGWVYSSLPVEIRAAAGGVEIRRLRQAVSPSGELTEELDIKRLDGVSASELESEAEAQGMRPAARRSIAPTADHVGSTVVVLEAA